MSPHEITHWLDTEIKPHEGALRGFLYHRLIDPTDIDDLVQETYRRVIRGRQEDTIHSPRGLLFTIARNLEKDLHRTQKQFERFSVAEMDQFDVFNQG